MMRIQLLGADDASVEQIEGEEGRALGRWREYVDSYVLRHATEWMPEGSSRHPLYLRRSVFGDELLDLELTAI